MCNNTRIQKAHSTTTIHKQKIQVIITSIIIRMHNAQILIITTTMHTQHTNMYYNLGQVVKKDEFLKHF